MQTTHKIAGSSAVRFARYLLAEASRGDYYTHDGEGRKSAPTQWHGPERLLRSFGIDPEKAVEMEHLGPLMQGFDPVTEKPIRPLHAGRASAEHPKYLLKSAFQHRSGERGGNVLLQNVSFADVR